MPHVGICAGGAGQLASLPRPTQGCVPSADSGPDHTVPGMSRRYPRFENGLAGCVKSREREGVRPRRLDGLVD